MFDGSPQVEDGYWRLAHELTEQLYVYDFSKRELPIILFVIHKTYSWGKNEDWIASNQIAEATGFDLDNVRKAVSSLIKENVLIKNGKKIGVNKYYNEWGTKKRIFKPRKKRLKQPDEPVKTTGNKESKDGQNNRLLPVKTTGGTVKTTHNNRSKQPPTKEKKETIQKKVKKYIGEIPDWIDLKIWNGFIEVREAKKAVNSEQAIKVILGKLECWKNEGHDPNEIIQNSIVNSWKGVFKPSAQSGNNKHNFDDVDYTYGVSADGKF
jgi:phage replication O-like protein O